MKLSQRLSQELGKELSQKLKYELSIELSHKMIAEQVAESKSNTQNSDFDAEQSQPKIADFEITKTKSATKVQRKSQAEPFRLNLKNNDLFCRQITQFFSIIVFLLQ